MIVDARRHCKLQLTPHNGLLLLHQQQHERYKTGCCIGDELLATCDIQGYLGAAWLTKQDVEHTSPQESDGTKNGPHLHNPRHQGSPVPGLPKNHDNLHSNLSATEQQQLSSSC